MTHQAWAAVPAHLARCALCAQPSTWPTITAGFVVKWAEADAVRGRNCLQSSLRSAVPTLRSPTKASWPSP
jgi:hypothetical protein